MLLRALLLLALAAGLTACGSDSADLGATADPADPPTEAASADAPAADAPKPDEATPDAPAAPAGSADAAPAGSAGSYSITFAPDADGGTATPTTLAGYLPAPVPADVLAMTPLDGIPSYHIRADASTVPESFELRGTYFLFLQKADDGQVRLRLLRGHVGLSNNFQTPYQGQIAAFTFPPLWPSGGPSPTLSLDGMGDNRGQSFASTPLNVLGQTPAWAVPLTLPAAPADEDFDVMADLELSDDTLLPFLLYQKAARSDRFPDSWELADFRPSRSEMRRRERENDTRTTTPYVVYPRDISADNPQAYLIVLRP